MRRFPSKKTEIEIADRFEGVLDYVPALDRVPFHIKREAAEKAAQVALQILRAEVTP